MKKLIIKQFAFLVLGFAFLGALVGGCSQSQKASSRFAEIVDINYDEDQKEVKIQDRSQAVGPSPQLGHYAGFEQSKSRNPVIGILIPPMGIHTLALVGMIKALEEDGVGVNIVVAWEFGSLVGGLYAWQSSANILEWHVFRFINKYAGKINKDKGYWYKAQRDFLTKIFSGKELSQLEKVLAIARELKPDNSLLYSTKGSLERALREHEELLEENQINELLSIIANTTVYEKIGVDIMIYPIFEQSGQQEYGPVASYYRNFKINRPKSSGNGSNRHVNIRLPPTLLESHDLKMVQTWIEDVYRATRSQRNLIQGAIEIWGK